MIVVSTAVNMTTSLVTRVIKVRVLTTSVVWRAVTMVFAEVEGLKRVEVRTWHHKGTFFVECLFQDSYPFMPSGLS